MKYIMQFDLLIIFTLIYVYLIMRILINSKFENHNVVRELFLTGFIISILAIIYFTLSSKIEVSPILLFLPLGFFTFVCIETNLKDAMVIYLLFALGVELAHMALPLRVFNIYDIMWSMVGGFIGTFASHTFVKKISA